MDVFQQLKFIRKIRTIIKSCQKNADAVLASYGTTIITRQETVRQRLNEKEENMKHENPIELSN